MKTANELLTMGEFFEEHGDYKVSEQLYRKALVIKERAMGKDSLELAPYLYNLGLIQFVLDRNTEAKSLLLRLVSLIEKHPNAKDEVEVDLKEIQQIISEIDEDNTLSANKLACSA